MDQQTQSSTPSQPLRPMRERKRLSVVGLILVVVGLVLFLQNLGFSWANNIWFPLVLIILGIWLVAKRT